MTKKTLSADGYADGATLQEIAEELGVTRERARQIEAAALRKLRRIAAERRLKAEDLMDVRRPGTD